MTFRSRPLLDLARTLPCTLMLPGCTARDCVPAHSNWQSEGKGKGEKAADCYFAAACPICHHLIDNDKTMSRAERRDAWLRGFMLTVLMLWESGLVSVSNSAPREPLPPRMVRRERFSPATARPSKRVPRRVA